MSKFKIIVFMCIALSFMVSCGNNEETDLMSVSTMVNKTVEGDECIVKLNGETFKGCDVQFVRYENEPAKLKMILTGLNPMRPIEAVVDLTQEENRILFSGSASGIYEDCHLEGIYSELWRENGKYQAPRVRLNIDYRSAFSCVDKNEFYFKIDGNCITNRIADNGQFPYLKNVLKNMGLIYAKYINRMKFEFNDDGTLDVFKQAPGDDELTLWHKLRYWPSQTNDIYIEFTEEQAKEFYDMWIGGEATNLRDIMLYNETGGGKYCLLVSCLYVNGLNSKVMFSLSDYKINYIAFEQFTKQKGKDIDDEQFKSDVQRMLKDWKNENDNYTVKGRWSIGIMTES